MACLRKGCTKNWNWIRGFYMHRRVNFFFGKWEAKGHHWGVQSDTRKSIFSMTSTYIYYPPTYKDTYIAAPSKTLSRSLWYEDAQLFNVHLFIARSSPLARASKHFADGKRVQDALESARARPWGRPV